MKKIFTYIAALCILASCTLDEDIYSNSTQKTFYKTAAQCEAGLNGCYNPLRNIFKEYKYFYIAEVQSDLYNYNSSGNYDAYCQVSTMQPEFASNLWNYLYQGVMRCNSIIASIERAPIKVEEKDPMIAEAIVIRALYYYLITCNFGDTPYYEEEVTDANNDRIARLPRMSASETRQKLIAQLREQLLVKKALPMYGTYDPLNPKQFRIGTAVGCMVAGKMCLWEGLWSDALDFFAVLEDLYGTGAGNPEGTLDKYSLSDVAFRNRYTPESILEMGQTVTDYGLKIYGELASRCEPMRASQDPDYEDIGSDDSEFDLESDFYAGVGIPELGRTSRTNSPIRPSTRMYKTLMPYNSPDLRRSSVTADGVVQGGGGWLQSGWVGYLETDDRSVATPSWHYFDGKTGPTDQAPYLGDKFWCFNMQYKMDTNNFKIYRYAGAVLNIAEAHLMRGDEDKAIAYLNQVRRRAGMPEVSASDFTDKDALLAFLQDECARELFGEYNRKHDLVRWGIWYDYVMQYGGSTIKKYAKPCHRYCPIPQVQITYSHGALDNDEYNQYGL